MGNSGYLAAANLRANARGMVAVLTALVLSVGLGGTVWFLQDNLERQTVTQSRDGTLAQYALTAGAGLPASAAAEARRIPGCSPRPACAAPRSSCPTGWSRRPCPRWASTLGARNGPWTCGCGPAASETCARTPWPCPPRGRTPPAGGWGPGPAVARRRHPVTLRVVALYERGWGFGDVTLHRDTLAGHTVTGLDDQVLVRTAPDAGAERDLAGLARRHPGGALVDAGALTGALAEDVAVSGWLNKMLVAVLVGYAVLAAANTLVMAALARTRELSLLRLAGVTRGQVRRMVHAEQAGLLGVALLIGAGIAAVTLTSVVRAVTGAGVPHVPAAGWAVLLGGTAVLALLATVLPVGRILRTAPVEGIGVRE